VPHTLRLAWAATLDHSKPPPLAGALERLWAPNKQADGEHPEPERRPHRALGRP